MSAVAIKLPATMTTGEFLRWQGDGTATRYELVDGLLVAMAPASGTHATLQANLTGILAAHLRASPCRVVIEAGVIPSLLGNENVRIPDLAVTCTANSALEAAIVDPVLVVEILSPGNKHKTWSNVWAYASMASVKDILIVSSWSMEAKLLSRDAAGAWPREATELKAENSVVLGSIDLEFPLSDIYAKTHLLT
jgi:Uma2 family endonuclease